MSNIGAILAVTLIVTQNPVPVPHPDPVRIPEDAITIPVGPLPWALPQLPAAVVDLGAGTPSYDEFQHTDGYAVNASAIEDFIGGIIGTGSVVGDAGGEVDAWIGVGGVLPDLSTVDFETGIDLPGYANMTASDIVTVFGTNIGTLFANIRALATLNLDIGEPYSPVFVIGIVVLCIAWMVLLQMIIFGVQFVDATISLTTRIGDLIIQLLNLLKPI